jgi:formiminotetrahydrofolate cyclodeaminase
MNQSSYADDSLRSFLVKLGGPSSEPAGGAALALAGASAAALVSLSCHSGERSARDADDALAFRSCRLRSEDAMARVQALIDGDVLAYRDVTKSLRMPRDTEETAQRRRQALDDALLAAVDVPLAVAETALETIDLALATAPRLDSPVVGDLAAAVCLAEAAVAGSLRNARINAGAIADRSRADAAIGRIDRLAGRATVLKQRVDTAFADAPRR